MGATGTAACSSSPVRWQCARRAVGASADSAVRSTSPRRDELADLRRRGPALQDDRRWVGGGRRGAPSGVVITALLIIQHAPLTVQVIYVVSMRRALRASGAPLPHMPTDCALAECCPTPAERWIRVSRHVRRRRSRRAAGTLPALRQQTWQDLGYRPVTSCNLLQPPCNLCNPSRRVEHLQACSLVPVPLQPTCNLPATLQPFASQNPSRQDLGCRPATHL